MCPGPVNVPQKTVKRASFGAPTPAEAFPFAVVLVCCPPPALAVLTSFCCCAVSFSTGAFPPQEIPSTDNATATALIKYFIGRVSTAHTSKFAIIQNLRRRSRDFRHVSRWRRGRCAGGCGGGDVTFGKHVRRRGLRVGRRGRC